MSTPKYKITINDLEKAGEVTRLERDGHNLETIHKALYKETEGLSQQERTKMISKLYDRKE